MRVLVTGSRDWVMAHEIYSRLEALYQIAKGAGDGFTLVHGACPSGADAIADAWARSKRDVVIETHPAQWQKRGRLAGPERNQLMVNLGADYCLAFCKDRSRGTLGCVRMAREAGIPIDMMEVTSG